LQITLPVLSVLRDVTQRHVFFVFHSNQDRWFAAIFAELMTSTVSSHFDFRFATVDSILAAHPDFSTEKVGRLLACRR